MIKANKKERLVEEITGLSFWDIDMLSERLIQLLNPEMDWEEQQEEATKMYSFLNAALLSLSRRKYKNLHKDLLEWRQFHREHGLPLRVVNHKLYTGRLRRRCSEEEESL